MRCFPLLLLAACQVPFEINRKDLGPFRVAALGVEGGIARAAVWSGLGLYHDEAPLLEWSLDGAPLGEGYEVPVPGPGTLELSVTAPDGAVHLAKVSVGEAPAAPFVERFAVGPMEAVDLDSRRTLEERPVDATVPEGEALRLRLGGLQYTSSVHWMSVLGQGSLLELDATTADVLAEELEIEDGVVVERLPLAPGLFHQLALVYDGAGNNRWIWIDGAIGLEGPFALHHERLLPVAEALAPGLYAFDVALEDSVEGVALSNPTAVDDLSAMDLACVPEGRSFALAWLAEGRCTRPELDGQQIVLEIR